MSVFFHNRRQSDGIGFIILPERILQGSFVALLSEKKIILGVTGGIAAYKAAELLRLFVRQGAEVRVIMTESATKFVGALTFQALSGHPVHTSLVDEASESSMGHIELARWADLIVIAPMTADFMARLVHGRANELLSALCLASEADLWVAPAMNNKMWLNTATQKNLELLQTRKVHVLGPASGEQACGETGLGRMLEPEDINKALQQFYEQKPLAGLNVVITAGPTREPIDPVRYISNRSSGKMGFALAEASVELGAQVVLVAGPTACRASGHIERIDVETAQDMAEAVKSKLTGCHIFISAAAVADYRVKAVADQKIKKTTDELTLSLTRNPDILSGVASSPERPFTVGFAAETENLLENAQSKLLRKGLDMVLANDVSKADRGFDVDVNQVSVVWKEGQKELALMPKLILARQIMEIISERYHAKSST